MIVPQPEDDLRRSELVMGKDIIKSLKESHKDYEVTEKLMKKFMEEDEARTPKDFMRTLVFLYTANIVDVDGLQITLSDIAERDTNQTTDLNDFGGNNED